MLVRVYGIKHYICTNCRISIIICKKKTLNLIQDFDGMEEKTLEME